MKIFKHYLVSILLLTFIILSGQGCSRQVPEDNSTFVFCSEGSPSGFNPQTTTDGTSSTASAKTVYDTLVAFEYGGTKIVPSLAQSWSISEDGLEYTFKLRNDVNFHQTSYFTPTRVFNADDVLFSFMRQKDSKHPYHPINGGRYEYFNGMEMGNIVKDVVKVDDYTVKFTLTRPESPFLANLAMAFTSILSSEYAEHLIKSDKMEDIDNLPIGTGAFIYKSYMKDNLIRFQSNEKYWNGPPKIKNLVFAITPDASVRFQKLKTGECHLITDPSPSDIDQIEKLENVKVLSKEGLNVGYLAMNVERAPFNNKNFRKAISYALNRKSYIDAIYLGHASIAHTPIPPQMWSYNDDVIKYEHNIELAKEYLKKSGIRPGTSIELWTLPVSRPYNPNGKKMGELMQSDLAQIGIKVKLVSYDWPTYLAKSRKGEHQLIQLGWTGDNGDPDNFLFTLLGFSSIEAGSNVARWTDDEFEKLIRKAKIESDLQKRTEYYKKAQEIVMEQAPWVTLAYAKVYKAMAKNVEGYKIDPFGHDIFKYVYFKK